MKFCDLLTLVLLLTLISGCEDEKEPTDVQPVLTLDSFAAGRVESDWQTSVDEDCNRELTICVANIEELNFALVQEYKTILLHPGNYDVGHLKVNSPLTLKSTKLWKAALIGESFIQINSDEVVIEGIKFEFGASPSGGIYPLERHGSIRIDGSQVMVKNNYFDQIGLHSTVSDKTGIAIHIVDAEEVDISNNVFIRSRSIAIKTEDYSRFINVHNNNFLDSQDFNGAGEVVHIGSAFSISQGVSPEVDETFVYFYQNFVSNWSLEKELISIKADKNRIYNNFFSDIDRSAIVIRMGNENEITSNIIIGNNTFPLRISGERNVIYDNLFCGEGAAVSLHAQMVYVTQVNRLYNSYWAANDNLIRNNQFYGYSRLAIMDEGTAVDDDFLKSFPERNLFQENLFVYPAEFNIDFSGAELVDNKVIETDLICPIQI